MLYMLWSPQVYKFLNDEAQQHVHMVLKQPFVATMIINNERCLVQIATSTSTSNRNKTKINMTTQDPIWGATKCEAEVEKQNNRRRAAK